MESENEVQQGATTHARHQRRRVSVSSLIVLAALICIAVALGVLNLITSRQPVVPSLIVKQISFPIYLPAKLPGTYQIDSTSFNTKEGILLFQANDTAGSRIIFTEQRAPKGFDFDAFYQQNMTSTKNLDNVPYSSVSGTSLDGTSKMLSIVAGDTWILITTRSAIDEAGLQNIAKHVTRSDD